MNIGKKHREFFEAHATPKQPGMCSSVCTVCGMLAAGVAILLGVGFVVWALISFGLWFIDWAKEADARAVVGGVGGSLVLIVLLFLAARRALR